MSKIITTVLATVMGVYSVTANSLEALESSGTTHLLIALDYDFDQDCDTSPVCFGLVDFMKSFEYDIGEGVVRVETFQSFNCLRDGIFRDRFQFNVKVELNGEFVGTLKSLTYDLATGIIWINTHELNFNC